MNRPLRYLKVAAVAAAIALLALTWGQHHAPPAQAAFQDSDGDGVPDLAEIISGSDPHNAASTPEDTGAVFVSGVPVCSDGIDNDLDGRIDNADNGCHDSDGSIVSDAMEIFLGSDPNDPNSSPEDSRFDAVLQYYGLGIATCGDGIDNNLNGLTDASDPACTPINSDGDAFTDVTEKLFGSDPSNPNSVPEHELVNPGSCSDGIDNDLDGLIDSADPACGSPSNDARANATVISSLPFTDGPLVMKNATVEHAEAQPSCAYNSLTGTVWYRYTAAADGVLIANTAGSNFQSVLAVWRDDTSRLTPIICDTGYDGQEYQSRVAFNVTAGQTYLFQINAYLFGIPMPSLMFHVEAGSPPPNDNLGHATVIPALPFADTVSTDAATTQFGEPAPFSCGYSLQSTVWYKFTATSDGLLVADTSDSSFPTILAVWTDSKFGLTSITCASSGYIGGPTQTFAPARLAFPAEAGRTYYFQIGGGYDESFGTVAFSLAAGIAAPNDDFENAAGITTLPFSANVDLLTATAQADEPLPTCFYGGQATASVWYRYTPAIDTFVMIEAESAGGPTAFAVVYQGSAIDSLNTVACASPFAFYPNAKLGLDAKAGQTYYIQLGSAQYSYGRGGTAPGSAASTSGLRTGEVRLSVSELPVPSCPAPAFSLADPTGDTLFPAPPPPGPITSPDVPPPPPAGPAPHDITGVSGGSNSQTLCLTVAFAGRIAPPDANTARSLGLTADFDIDENPHTGYGSSIDYACGVPAYLGVDLSLNVGGGSGNLVPLYPSLLPPGPGAPPLFAIAVYHQQSITLVIPRSVLSAVLVSDPAGIDHFDFAVAARPYNGPPSDCAPNGGFIHAPNPATWGDADCNGTIDARDTAVVLQLVAGLIPRVPCSWVADVNGSGIIGPIDALLILQFSAGMLPALPVTQA